MFEHGCAILLKACLSENCSLSHWGNLPQINHPRYLRSNFNTREFNSREIPFFENSFFEHNLAPQKEIEMAGTVPS